jgi:hypothetical protein
MSGNIILKARFRDDQNYCYLDLLILLNKTAMEYRTRVLIKYERVNEWVVRQFWMRILGMTRTIVISIFYINKPAIGILNMSWKRIWQF